MTIVRSNYAGFKWHDQEGDWIVVGHHALFGGWEVYNVQMEFYTNRSEDELAAIDRQQQLRLFNDRMFDIED